ncbi:hypothetical protein RRG08_001629 [Elysia crispata]|uniref:Uncharacterized protein n=1 Tax=Elysia crispata TaxID=231223 RepID=A0AAE1DZZ8_9GAST|nr:hypothetical protein RRG08_001629 [Elysia crispata]
MVFPFSVSTRASRGSGGPVNRAFRHDTGETGTRERRREALCFMVQALLRELLRPKQKAAGRAWSLPQGHCVDHVGGDSRRTPCGFTARTVSTQTTGDSLTALSAAGQSTRRRLDRSGDLSGHSDRLQSPIPRVKGVGLIWREGGAVLSSRAGLTLATPDKSCTSEHSQRLASRFLGHLAMAAGEANLSKELGVPGVSKRNVSYRRYGCNQIQIIRSSVTILAGDSQLPFLVLHLDVMP